MADDSGGFGKPILRIFDFVPDKVLREGLEDAMLFVFYLIDTASAAGKVKERQYKEELHRVTVLYIASVVEAMCLFYLEQNQVVREKVEYKNVTRICVEGVSVNEGELVAAIRRKTEPALKEVPFADSINFLYKCGKISGNLKRRLDSLRKKRNTQHLYGRGRNRPSPMDVFDVFESMKTFRLIYRHIRRNLNKGGTKGRIS